MNINTITAEDLRRMPDKEGLILQGCGGDLTEWVDGINEMLTKAGILKDGCQFENVAAFQHGELTCLLYPFDDVKLDIGKLALWRLQTHEVYGGTWLSDFVPNYLGGFIETPEALADKPDCPLIGADGNIFNLLGIASRTLREHGLKEQAKEMSDRVFVSGSYGEALCIIGEYVNITDSKAGHINCVIVKDLSRLGRNSIDTGYYIEQYFHAHNVRFIAVTDQFDTADSGNLHGGIMLPLKNMINEAYALDIGRKIKAQARQAMKDGDYIGARAPYGYRKDPDDCHKLLIDENTAPVVKQIFEWAHEHVALNRIVRNLNEMGIPAPSHYKKTTGEITSPGLIGSGKWQTRTVMKILESEVYTGDLVQGKTKIVDHQQVKAGEDNLIIAKCTHEPIISHELFNAVQEYRKQICEESKATPKRPYTPNIFKWCVVLLPSFRGG